MKRFALIITVVLLATLVFGKPAICQEKKDPAAVLEETWQKLGEEVVRANLQIERTKLVVEAAKLKFSRDAAIMSSTWDEKKQKEYEFLKGSYLELAELFNQTSNKEGTLTAADLNNLYQKIAAFEEKIGKQAKNFQ